MVSWFGAGAKNPSAGVENTDNSTALEKNQFKTPKPFESNAQYSKNKKKKKKKSPEQCEVNSEKNKNVETIEIIDRIEENPGLARAAQKTRKNQDVKNSIDHLIN